MKDYGREFVGFLELPQLPTTPTFDSNKHTAKLFFNTTENRVIIGNPTGWNIIGGNVESIITSADSVTINWSTCNSALLTLDRATTSITMTNPIAGNVYRIRVLQDATGSRLITFIDTIKWRGGAAPTLTTTANKADWITLVYTSLGWDADANCNF